MTALTDPSTYPISAAAVRQLDRPLFGHFVDGGVAASIDGGTMPVIDPATGAEVATAAAGSARDVDRAVRSARAAFDDGRWRHLPPLEQERRLRDRKSTRLNSSHQIISYAVFCLKKKKNK